MAQPSPEKAAAERIRKLKKEMPSGDASRSLIHMGTLTAYNLAIERAAREAERGRGEEPAEVWKRERMLFTYGGWKCSNGCELVCAPSEKSCAVCGQTVDEAFAASSPAAPSADALLAAIKKHHGQRADDRCVLDDDELYAAAGLPAVDRRVGDKTAMLENCRRFIERRCEGGGWPTYRELEEVADAALALEDAERGEDGIQDMDLTDECKARLAQALGGLRVARAALSAPAARPALSPYLPRAADALADAVLDLTDRHVIGTRSRAADALLSYCGIRCNVHGDEINAYRKFRSASAAGTASEGGKA